MLNSNELTSPEALEKLHEAAEKLIDAATVFITAVVETIKRAAKVINDFMPSFFKAVSQKIHYLACHARKQRVCKKNRQRLWYEINHIYHILR